MNNKLRRLRYIISAIIVLSLVAGYALPIAGDVGIPMENTVLAATNKKITVSINSDFTLKLPVNWKNNYVIKKSKKKEKFPYVAFYSKKCYQQKKEGWLFTIMRYKDDSYTDMPSYELVGKWNGYQYVALFPTDVQTEGASKTAKTQYKKLSKGIWAAVTSIKPIKKRAKGKDIYICSDFSLKLPSSWKNNYIVKAGGKKKKFSYVAFYEKGCYRQKKQGWLFSIGMYTDETYKELPSYELVGKWNGVSYVAEFPTDVQFEVASKAAAKQYQKMSKSVGKVVRSIRR